PRRRHQHAVGEKQIVHRVLDAMFGAACAKLDGKTNDAGPGKILSYMERIFGEVLNESAQSIAEECLDSSHSHKPLNWIGDISDSNDLANFAMCPATHKVFDVGDDRCFVWLQSDQVLIAVRLDGSLNQIDNQHQHRVGHVAVAPEIG